MVTSSKLKSSFLEIDFSPSRACTMHYSINSMQEASVESHGSVLLFLDISNLPFNKSGVLIRVGPVQYYRGPD